MQLKFWYDWKEDDCLLDDKSLEYLLFEYKYLFSGETTLMAH